MQKKKSLLHVFLMLLFFTQITLPAAHMEKEEKNSEQLIDSDELIQAINNKDQEKAIKLIKSGKINLNFNTSEGTALTATIYNNFIDIAKILLANGADVNADKGRAIPDIILATIKGNADFIKLLLEHGANVNITSLTNSTAIIEAARDNCIKIMKILLEYDADINAKEFDGSTALSNAIEKEFNEVINLLHHWEAMCNFKKIIFETYKNYNIENFKLYPTLLNETSNLFNNIFCILRNKNNGNTLLHEAIIKQDLNLIHDILNFDIEVVKELLNIKNNEGLSPIDLSVSNELILNQFMNLAFASTDDVKQTIAES